MSRLTRYFAAWIACFAVVLASLAPSISHALAANGHAFIQAEICSINGPQLANASNDEAPVSSAPAGKGMLFEHCPFCLTHGGSFGLPPTVALTFPVANDSAAFPLLFYQSPHPLFVWATPHSRAPPAIV